MLLSTFSKVYMQIEPFEAEQNKQKVAVWMSRKSVPTNNY